MTNPYPHIPSKAEAFKRLNELLDASSPTHRTYEQEREIKKAWEMCDNAKVMEYLNEARRHG